MKTVQILGAGWGWGHTAPLDLNAEIWGTNNLMFARYSGQFDHWTRWFDHHPIAHIQRRRPQAYAWYQQQDGRRPIYLAEPDPTIPGAVVFPAYELVEHFSTPAYREVDFWGSISWLIAFAMKEGFQRIDLFWFLLKNDQYTKQIPSTKYWIGRARQAGIDVVIHGDSALKPNHGLYGCEALAPQEAHT